MIDSIRKRQFYKNIKEHQNYNHNPSYHGVNPCNSICILTLGSGQSYKSAAEGYVDKMKSIGKKAEVIYYYDNKEEVEDGYSKKDVKWNGVPENVVVESLLKRDYDLFIFLCPKMESHLEYIVTLSKAKFKIGPNFESANLPFDLMIEADDYSDSKTLLKNIDKQLMLLST